VGVPLGGLEGQILAKLSDTDNDTTWIDNSAESTYYLVRNNTGATIPKGTLVAASGAEPSGRVDVAPFEVTGLQDSELRVMGVATANISNGVNGTVMSFGTLKDIDTRGSTASAIAVGDETWAEGDILYAHPTVDGKLTKVRPQHDLAVAFITVRHASSGQIAVRIVPGNFHLEWMHDVAITTPTAGQVLAYNDVDELWENIDIASSSIAVAETAPTSPEEGDVWYDSTNGKTYIYYDSYWVEQTSALIGPQGPAGVVTATSPLTYSSGTQTVGINLANLGPATFTGRARIQGTAGDTSGVLELRSNDGGINYIYKADGAGLVFGTGAGNAMTVNQAGRVNMPFQPCATGRLGKSGATAGGLADIFQFNRQVGITQSGSLLTVQASGLYLIGVNHIANISTGRIDTSIAINGVGIAAALSEDNGTGYHFRSLQIMRYLNANDYIQYTSASWYSNTNFDEWKSFYVAMIG
jgi:hypothetical protein